MIIKLLFTLVFSLGTFSLNASEDHLMHIEAGNSHAKGGNYSQALASLNAAIAKDPSNARSYKLRGHVYYAMGDHVRALNDLDRVVALSPGSANAYADRAIIYSVLGHHGQALTDVERALSLKPDSHFSKSVRAQIISNALGK